MILSSKTIPTITLAAGIYALLNGILATIL